MKKLICLALILCLFINPAYAFTSCKQSKKKIQCNSKVVWRGTKKAAKTSVRVVLYPVALVVSAPLWVLSGIAGKSPLETAWEITEF